MTGNPAALLDVERLRGQLEELRERFDAALPFRHVVIDGFFLPAVAEALHAEFPSLDAAQFRAARWLEARSYNVHGQQLRPSLRNAFDELGAQPFTQWLRDLTGIVDAEMDPNNVGGGAHQGARGSRLRVHADHNTHPDDPSRYRRLNVLVYLNPNWVRGWGGELELWDASCSRVERRIEPTFNRCVIMECHDRAFHGYRPLRFPENQKRESLAAYYYSSAPAALQAREPHLTVFGVERDEHPARRVISRLRKTLLARVFPSFQGLPPRNETATDASAPSGSPVGRDV